MGNSRAPVEYDPFSPAVQADPYPVYRRLRDDAPVHHNAERDLWSLSRYDDVSRASRDWRTFSTAEGSDPDYVGKVLGLNGFLDLDPPRHDELRKLVFDVFAPAAIAALEPEVTRQADALIDALAERDEADLARQFAAIFPLGVVSHVLGVPHADGPDLMRLVFRCYEPSPFELTDSVNEARLALRAYFSDALDDRRQGPRNDVLTRLAAARTSADADLEEVLDICLLLFTAGYVTTAGLLGTALHELALHPTDRSALRAQPGRWPQAVEEFLRFDAPVQLLARTVRTDVTLHGTTIPAGARVLLLYASANHDERQFPDPERLDLTRPDNRHLSFGEGIHRCLGSTLARLEGRVGLRRVVERLPDYELAGPVSRTMSAVSREIVSLPVAFERRS
ncbi:MAG TPA: cytochrome P450 [Acidimicrobiales bacterium]|nr:cytochrome P450 [Acidimicrobiales bacterium]